MTTRTGGRRARPPVALFLDPLSERSGRDRLFGEHPYGDYNAPYRHVKQLLEARGIPVHTGDFLSNGHEVGELNLYVTTGTRARYRMLARRPDVVLSAFLVQECPVAEPELFADLVEASKVFKRMYSFGSDDALRPFLEQRVSFRPYRYPYPFDAVDDEAWGRGDRRFLVMINANKVPRLKTQELYSERLRAVEFFGRYEEIDLYGFGWDGPSFRIGESRVPAFLRRLQYWADGMHLRLRPNRDPLLAAARRVYKGPAASKLATLSRYSFALCYENQVLDGWVTEKLFDCLAAGTVPIYLGAPDIDRWVWPECFIDARRFSRYEELRAFLHALSPADIARYREAGREYFHSPAFAPFSKQAFAGIFLEILAEDAGVVT